MEEGGGVYFWFAGSLLVYYVNKTCKMPQEENSFYFQIPSEVV